MDLDPNLQASESTLAVTPSATQIQIKGEHYEEPQTQDYTDGAPRAWSTVAGAFLLSLYTVGLVSV
jgi:hypothetical protein